MRLVKGVRSSYTKWPKREVATWSLSRRTFGNLKHIEKLGDGKTVDWYGGVGKRIVIPLARRGPGSRCLFSEGL